MIFLGDVASPDKTTSEQLESFFCKNDELFARNRIICNFEGLISERKAISDSQPILFNHISVPEILNRGVPPVLCLANNHVLDLPRDYVATVRILKSKNIIACGAGNSRESASEPACFEEAGKRIIIYNACWDFLLYNQHNPSKGVFVATIDENKLITEVKQKKSFDGDISIIVFLHWNLDLEILPFPMYRVFSRSLIDAGADVVIGTHSHCVQGGEKYKNGFIIYGLGNFYIPSNVFVGGKLVYPDFAAIQLALEWDPLTNKATCHWFEYRRTLDSHELIHCGTDIFEESKKLKSLSPFQGMSDVDYITYFKKHRRKSFLIPVFTDHQRKYTNIIFTSYLKSRARLAHMMARMNIIKWQN